MVILPLLKVTLPWLILRLPKFTAPFSVVPCVSAMVRFVVPFRAFVIDIPAPLNVILGAPKVTLPAKFCAPVVFTKLVLITLEPLTFNTLMFVTVLLSGLLIFPKTALPVMLRLCPPPLTLPSVVTVLAIKFVSVTKFNKLL